MLVRVDFAAHRVQCPGMSCLSLALHLLGVGLSPAPLGSYAPRQRYPNTKFAVQIRLPNIVFIVDLHVCHAVITC